MHLQQLKRQRHKLQTEMKALLDAADAERRGLNEEEEKRWDVLKAELDQVEADIAQMEGFLDDQANERGVSRTGTHRSARDIGEPPTYETVFGGVQAGTDGWDSMEEYLRTVAAGLNDDRLRIGATHGGFSDPQGGWLMPEAFSAELIGPALERSALLSRADVREQTTKVQTFNGFASFDHSAGKQYGGFSAKWLVETGNVPEDTGELNKMRMELGRLGLFTKSSVELEEFAAQFEPQLRTVLQSAAEWSLDDALLNGTGAGQPLGLLNAPSTISVAKEGSQAADTIVYENLTNMLSRLHAASFNRSIWLANPTTIPELLELTIAVGSGGSHIQVLQESNGEFRMLTRPVFFTEKLPQLGDKGDIVLVDPSQYLVTLHRRLVLDKSIHVGFQTGEIAWRLLMFAAGQPKWEKAFTPSNGQTQSWAVTLDERA